MDCTPSGEHGGTSERCSTAEADRGGVGGETRPIERGSRERFWYARGIPPPLLSSAGGRVQTCNWQLRDSRVRRKASSPGLCCVHQKQGEEKRARLPAGVPRARGGRQRQPPGRGESPGRPAPAPGESLTAMTLTKVVLPEYCSPTSVSSISSFQNSDRNQSRNRDNNASMAAAAAATRVRLPLLRPLSLHFSRPRLGPTPAAAATFRSRCRGHMTARRVGKSGPAPAARLTAASGGQVTPARWGGLAGGTGRS